MNTPKLTISIIEVTLKDKTYYTCHDLKSASNLITLLLEEGVRYIFVCLDFKDYLVSVHCSFATKMSKETIHHQLNETYNRLLQAYEQKDFDFYQLEMTLQEGKKQAQEKYTNLSLSDFEVIYGNETRKIIDLKLNRQKGMIV